MAVVVRCLPPALGERDELVADVDERHAPGSAAQRELEDAAVELERLLDVPDLQRDVVDSDRLRSHDRLAPHCHGGPGRRPGSLAADRGGGTGLILHFYGDRVPHEDIDSRRFEIGSGVAGVLALALVRGPFDSATVGAIATAARHRARGSASAAWRAEALPQPPDPGLAPAGRPDR